LKSTPVLNRRLLWAAGMLGAFLLLLLIIRGSQPPEKQPSPAPDPVVPVANEPPPPSSESAPAPFTQVAPAAEEVRNLPPEVISVMLEPELVFPGTPVRALVEARDPEGDLITIAYRWQRNREDLAEQTGDTLDTSALRKGDWITVAVTAADEYGRGLEKMGRSVVVHNRPPEIASFPPAATGSKIVYQVVATDPDGDPLSFSLESAPPGMTIDTASGQLEWKVPEALSGSFQVRIIVSDGDAQSFQQFTLNLVKK
jgi:hypothetical protein